MEHECNKAHEATTDSESYRAFSTKVLDTIYDIRALVESARSRMTQHDDCDTSYEIIDSCRVLRLATERLDAIALDVSNSEFRYTP
jgi:hypothetical protein